MEKLSARPDVLVENSGSAMTRMGLSWEQHFRANRGSSSIGQGFSEGSRMRHQCV